jgi:hypothetical protein
VSPCSTLDGAPFISTLDERLVHVWCKRASSAACRPGRCLWQGDVLLLPNHAYVHATWIPPHSGLSLSWQQTVDAAGLPSEGHAGCVDDPLADLPADVVSVHATARAADGDAPALAGAVDSEPLPDLSSPRVELR